MPTTRVAILGTFTLLSFYLFETVAHSEMPKAEVFFESPDNSGLIATPVMYRDQMLVVVTDEGVAAIVFQEKDPKLVNTSAKYRFRFLKDAESEEVTGAGIVHDNKGENAIKAGPIRVGWSGGGHDRGHIYYRPEDMQICMVHAKRFNDSFVEEVANVNHPIQKLDLRRFLKKQN